MVENLSPGHPSPDASRFTRAIVRRPCRSMVHGLTTAGLGVPDYERALAQHDAYIAALERCGLAVTVLPPEEAFPDSTFVEDTALVTQAGAIITRPGAPSRRDETVSIAAALRRHFDRLDQIVAPGTVDAGDILAVGGHYFIGISGRTEVDGAAQMTRWLAARGMSAATVPLRAMLHLKSGVACLENNNLIVAGELRDRAEWSGFNTIPVDNEEGYAVNCLWLNGTVLVAAGFPKTKAAIERLGYPTIALDMSEFHKLDGGLSCLSLRF